MHERGRQEGSDCDGDIDQDALERLESMQRQRIMEMFGYDAEEENAMLRAKKEERAPQVDLRAKKARVQKPTSLPSEPRDQPVRSELPRFDGKGTRPVRHQTASEQTALKPKTSENFMSSKVSKVHGGEEKSSGVIRGRKLRKETGDEDFISTARIVEELGASMFAGRKRRAWEEKKLKAMGAKGPKKQKVPYDILMRRNKKIAKLEELEEKREVESGMRLKAVKKKRKGKTVLSLNSVGVLNVQPLQTKHGKGRAR